MKLLLSIVLLGTMCPEGETLTCLHCDNIFQPRHCRTVTTCKDEELCGTELVTNNHGSNLFNIGCVPKSTCENSMYSNRTCLQCCNSNLCNVNLCGQPEYPTTIGPICYSCPVYNDNSMCKDIDFCAKDEVCNVKAKLEFSERVYTSSCVTKSECSQRNSLGSMIIGKRSIPKDVRGHEQEVCDICCDSDICNQNCDSALSDLDECRSNPCVHGTCEDQVGTFVCHCDSGFTGGHCETAVRNTDACLSNPCMNGTCVNHAGSFVCQCDSGFTGHLCDTDLDECYSYPCVHGTCEDRVGTFVCHCESGFTGVHCETAVRITDACLSNPCMNGVCINHAGSFVCQCDSGFSGYFCESDVDECISSPCLVGTCIDEVNSYRCLCDEGYGGAHCQRLSDCVDVQFHVSNISDVYSILLTGTNDVVRVYCDMDTDGGGWTVFQNRFNGSVDFNRSFAEYENGFGDLQGEFWLGLRYIYKLTSQIPTQLRIDVETADGTKGYEMFDVFSLSPGPEYTLHVSSPSGTAGNKRDTEGMMYSSGQDFSAYDRDRDSSSSNCALKDMGGWWFGGCSYVNLNGHYYPPGENHGWGIIKYYSFDRERSLKSAKMMFKRSN